MSANPLPIDRVKAPKLSWVARRIPPGQRMDWRPAKTPRVGDVLLCEVLQPSLHTRLETSTGGRSRLYPGDYIVCAVGARYATSLLEGAAEIDGEFADLLSASGLCGRVVQRSSKTARATSLRIVAQAHQRGRPVNLRAFQLAARRPATTDPAWVIVVGSAMDSGKTTACTSLINGFARSGLKVGAAKLTGTASLRDLYAFKDAGATPALDFLDCGWPSTAGCTSVELAAIASRLCAELRSDGVDVGVLEIADGLLQTETSALLEQLRDRLHAPAVVLTTRESLAALAGVELLVARGLTPVAVSGVVTSSPLAIREVEEAVGVSCIPTDDLGEHARAIAGLQLAEPRVASRIA